MENRCVREDDCGQPAEDQDLWLPAVAPRVRRLDVLIRQEPWHIAPVHVTLERGQGECLRLTR